MSALTTFAWRRTLRFYIDNDPDGTSGRLAAVLDKIVSEVDDPALAKILDSYALQLLEGDV